jgi:transcriptional regulator with XRE-family HTH domain
MDFAQRLKEIREERNLSQEQLAKVIDRSRTSVSGYETYDRLPDLDTLIKLSRFFEVSVDWLLGFSDIKKINKSNECPENIYNEVFEFMKEELLSAGIILNDKPIPAEIIRLSIKYGLDAAIEILKLKK